MEEKGQLKILNECHRIDLIWFGSRESDYGFCIAYTYRLSLVAVAYVFQVLSHTSKLQPISKRLSLVPQRHYNVHAGGI